MTHLKHATGNLLDLAEAGHFDVIVHGCNCFNTMGGGIAREIRDRYPNAYFADCKTARGDYDKLGTYTVSVEDGFTIINSYTQFNMSRGADVFEYVAFALILQKLAHKYPKSRFGLPYIGMGLAGGDKATIMKIIEEFADTVHNTGGSVTIVQYAP